MIDVEIHRDRPDSPWTYALLDRRQRELQSALLVGGASGKLLLSEVAPVVTLGRNSGEGLRTSRELLRARGIDLYATDRGGKATYHGPGQWVLFIVERLDRLVGDPRGVKETFRRLERMTLKVAREWCPKAEIREGKWSGIWSRPGARSQKLASFGIKVDRGVLLHGIAVNAFATPESFGGIDPCGLPARPGFLMADRNENEFVRVGERLVQEAVLHFSTRRFRLV